MSIDTAMSGGYKRTVKLFSYVPLFLKVDNKKYLFEARQEDLAEKTINVLGKVKSVENIDAASFRADVNVVPIKEEEKPGIEKLLKEEYGYTIPITYKLPKPSIA